jgi:Leucine-rich repeat (LRR) protein
MHASIQNIEPISQLAKLEVLGLTLSKVGDDQIGVLSNCSSLHELQLEGAQISEHGLKKLACLPNLRELAIQNTNISSAVYEVLSKFCSLEQIYVDQEIEESTIKHLRKLKNLKRIYCGDTINQEHQAILRERLGIDVF